MKRNLTLLLFTAHIFLSSGCSMVQIESKEHYVECKEDKYRVKIDGELQCVKKQRLCVKEKKAIIKKDGSWECKDSAAVGASYVLGYLLSIALLVSWL